MSILSANQARQKRGIIAMVVMFIVFTVIFYLKSNRVEDITFGFIVDTEWQLVNEWQIGSKSGAALFLVLSLVGIGISYLQFQRGKKILLGSFIFGFGSILAFLCWTASGKFVPFTGILQGAVMFSVPLIFGSMSGLLCEKSGVINIAIEGQLLFAACISAMVASISHNVIVGLLFAPIAGALVSLLLAFFAIKYQVDQVILGFVLNVLVIGITGYIYSKLLVPYGDVWNVGPTFKRISIPFLSQIPVVGPIFFNQTIVVYLMNSGVHTDFVLPVSNEHVDWRRYFPIENTKEKDTSLTFIAIGWGDKDFYLNTPEWADLTLKTAVSAGLGLGTSAVHATYHASILKDRPTVKLTITINQNLLVKIHLV